MTNLVLRSTTIEGVGPAYGVTTKWGSVNSWASGGEGGGGAEVENADGGVVPVASGGPWSF